MANGRNTDLGGRSLAHPETIVHTFRMSDATTTSGRPATYTLFILDK